VIRSTKSMMMNTMKPKKHTHTQIQEKKIRKEEAIGLLMNSTQEM